MKFTIAVAQIDTTLGDLKKNVAKHVEFTRKAKSSGADLVVFPELSLSGYSVKDSSWDVAIRTSDAKFLNGLLDESRDIAIICGGVEESSSYGIHNSAFLFDRGTLTSVHRKLYPPTYGMFEELRYFSPGSSARAFESSVGRLGVLVCEDLWHLPLSYLLAQDGAEVIIGIAASPTRLSGADAVLPTQQVNSEQHKTYARLLSTYVVFCNRVGYEDGVNFWGGSSILAPNGDIVAEAKLFGEEMIYAEIDRNEIRRARRLSRHFLDDRRDVVIRELKRFSKREDH